MTFGQYIDEQAGLAVGLAMQNDGFIRQIAGIATLHHASVASIRVTQTPQGALIVGPALLHLDPQLKEYPYPPASAPGHGGHVRRFFSAPRPSCR